jgi:membrane protein
MAESRFGSKNRYRNMWRRGGLTPRQLAELVWLKLDEHNVVGRSSELAFNFVLAVFPLLLVLISILGILAYHGTQMRQLLFHSFSQLLPFTAWELMNKTLLEITQASGGGKLTVGIVLTLWLASGGTASMMSAMSGAYGLRESRSWLKMRGIALALTLAIAVLVISALTLVLGGRWIVDGIASRIPLSFAVVLIWKVMQWPAAVVFMSIAFDLVYYYGPDVKERHWYWITPGSLLGVLLWIAVSLAFRLCVYFFNTYNATYGSLGAAIILLIWFWVTGFAFLVGGEINAQIEQAAAHRGQFEAMAEDKMAA